MGCVIIAASMQSNGAALNGIVDIVNSALAILLPFALTPLARLVTSKAYFGEFAANAINVLSLSCPGAGFFGDLMIGVTQKLPNGISIQYQTAATVQYNILNDVAQVAMLLYMLYFVFIPIDTPMRDVNDPRPVEDEGCFGVVQVLGKNDASTIVEEENENNDETQ